MNEHICTAKRREYRMKRRAESVNGTRRRLVDAAVQLHTTVGPANTTVTAIAAQAGVTRLTVYSHFRDIDRLFEACRSHWRSLHPPPDIATWAAIADPHMRAVLAVNELYAWYGANGSDLYPIYRDMAAMPESTQQTMKAERRAMADVLVGGTSLRGAARRRLRAAVGHVTSFWTHRSLTSEGLDDKEAADLAVRLLEAAGLEGRARGVT